MPGGGVNVEYGKCFAAGTDRHAQLGLDAGGRQDLEHARRHPRIRRQIRYRDGATGLQGQPVEPLVWRKNALLQNAGLEATRGADHQSLALRVLDEDQRLLDTENV